MIYRPSGEGISESYWKLNLSEIKAVEMLYVKMRPQLKCIEDKKMLCFDLGEGGIK